MKKHLLPSLEYAHDALEPCIDARTLRLHHDVHHRAYVDGLNAALENLPGLQERTALWLLCHLDEVPEESRLEVRHSAGGHVNHSLFWRCMQPAQAGGPRAPSGALLDAIDRDFGGLPEMKACFEEAGTKLFGSGWVWLARDRQDAGRLSVLTTSGHDNPAMHGSFPVLLNDVWEHAYYLGHENRRSEYLKAWWPAVDWEEAGRRFGVSGHDQEEVWEGEGGQLLVS